MANHTKGPYGQWWVRCLWVLLPVAAFLAYVNLID